MANFNDFESEEKPGRIGITFDAEQKKRFLALAEFDTKRPATLAAEIIAAYMDTRAADIDSILQVKAEYGRQIGKLRERKKVSGAADDK